MANTIINKLDRLNAKFSYLNGKPDLEYYGAYRMGLTGDEIKDYLRVRANTFAISKIYKKFVNIAGCNTMSITPDGKGLMFRHDVERYADKLFLNKETYWD